MPMTRTLVTSVQFNADSEGKNNILIPGSAAGVIRVFPRHTDAEGYTRLAFGGSTIAVPTIDVAAFSVQNNVETIFIPPTGATYMAAQGNSIVEISTMTDP